VIYDGGIRLPSDIVKALAFGASAVILGGLFAGCVEAPGEAQYNPALNQWERIYRGSASMEVKGDDRNVEGARKVMSPKGSVGSILDHLVDGIRSGISYLGALDIDTMQTKAEYYTVTANGLVESHPHGLRS
jgi:IMP dehydrogenase